MRFLENLLRFFKSEKKDYVSRTVEEFKVPKLRSDIGVTTANCPYCNAELDKFPVRKTRCRNCRQYMYVRTRPVDRKKILCKETDLQLVEEEWEKKRLQYENVQNNELDESYNREKVESLTIDVSDKLNLIVQNLIKHYDENCKYDEILRISKKDRLPMLKYIWSRWAYRTSGTVITLEYNYPQYDKNDIEFIVETELHRLTYIRQSHEYQELQPADKIFKTVLISYRKHIGHGEEYNSDTKEYKIPILKLCLPVDMQKIGRVWRESDGKINYTDFSLCGRGIADCKKVAQEIFFYKEGKEFPMTKEELKIFCDKNGYEYPLWD